MLCGLLRPTGGQARVAGQDLLRAPAEARARIGYMAQRFSLYAELSASSRTCASSPASMASAGRAADPRHRRRRSRGSTSPAPPTSVAGELPLGLKQRLALAAALLHGPDILFLDEPTSGVDPLTRRDFWARIGSLADTGVTILVTSHFMDEAEYCDRLGIVEPGQACRRSDTPAALRARVRTIGTARPDVGRRVHRSVVQAP